MIDRARLPGPLRSGLVAAGSSSSALCLRVALLGSQPEVWRRLRVPSRMTLRRLHAVLRCALGRPEAEAHRFRVGDVLYGNTAEGLPTRDSRWETVGDIAALGVRSFRYELAAPETLVHEVRVEALLEGGGDEAPLCLDGGGVWPGEPAGGGSEDRVDFMPADAPVFDLAAVNAMLVRLR